MNDDTREKELGSCTDIRLRKGTGAGLGFVRFDALAAALSGRHVHIAG